LAIGELIRSGKIRYFGVSNFRGWRIAEIVRLCREMNAPRPVVCQPYYLTGKYQPGAEPPQDARAGGDSVTG
jgi:aryl-alcohol dehydrogenase-like predicted oxidoreductase